MMLEFRNNQNENFEENDSVYHYDYINSESNASGNSPKHDKDLRKMMKRAAAIALAVVMVGGSFGAGRYMSSQTGTVAQASETESETETSTEAASTSTDDGSTYSVKEIVANAMPSMVAITNKGVQEVQSYFYGQTYQQETESTGSGVIIGKNDDELLIATNNHVVSGAQTLSVCFSVDAEDSDDLVVSADVKGTDPNHDLAIVTVKLSDISDDVKSKIKVMEVGSSDNLALGEQVVAIGNALGYGQSVTSGIVSALDREVTVETDDGNTVTNNMIQTDASINPGNSGGALLNMKGQLVGINSVKASATGVEGMGYAIPIDTAMPIFSELEAIQSRDIVDEDKRGFMGIKPVDITSEAKQIYNMPSGAFVYEVTNDSAAEKAGLKRGDIITKMDGVIISSAEDLYDRMQYYAAGDEMTVTIERAEGGEYKEQEITLTLDEKPESAKTSSSSQSTQGSNGQNGNGQNDQGGNDQNGGSDNGSDTEQDPFSQIFPEYFRK